MKRIFLTLVAMVVVLGVSAQTTTIDDNTPWPITPKNQMAEHLMVLDAGAEEYSRDMDLQQTSENIYAAISDEPKSAEQINAEMTAYYREVKETWRRFVWLCNEDRGDEALQLFMDHDIDFVVYLGHSSYYFYLHDAIISQLVLEHMPMDDGVAYMTKLMEFDYEMAVAMCQSTGYKSECLYDLYDRLYALYNYSGEYNKLMTLITDATPILFDMSPEWLIEIITKSEQGDLILRTGNYASAKGVYKDVQKLIKKNRRGVSEEYAELITLISSDLEDKIERIDAITKATKRGDMEALEELIQW